MGSCKNGLNQEIKPFGVGKDPKTINELRKAIYLATSVVADCKAIDVNEQYKYKYTKCSKFKCRECKQYKIH